MSARRLRVWLLRALIVAAFFGFVELVARARLVDAISLVPVSRMLERLVALVASGRLTPHVVQTSTAVLASLALALLAGVPLGLLLWRAPLARRVLEPYLATYYAVPIFAFYPLLIALFGVSLLPIILIAWAWAVVAVVINTALGFSQIKPVYGKVARSLRLTPLQAYRSVYFPAAAPQLFTGFKLAVIYSVIGVVASEFILASDGRGLGYVIAYNFNNFLVADMYAVILLVLGLTAVLNAALLVVEQRVYGRRG